MTSGHVASKDFCKSCDIRSLYVLLELTGWIAGLRGGGKRVFVVTANACPYCLPAIMSLSLMVTEGWRYLHISREQRS